MSFHRLTGGGDTDRERERDRRAEEEWEKDGDGGIVTREEARQTPTVPEAEENEACICFFSSTSSLFRAAMYLE